MQIPDGLPVHGTVDVVDDAKVQLDTPPQNGTATVEENGSWSYTPNPGFFGTDTFLLRIDLPDGRVLFELLSMEVPLARLPQTGKLVNTASLLGVGSLLILVGGAYEFISKKKRR